MYPPPPLASGTSTIINVVRQDKTHCMNNTLDNKHTVDNTLDNKHTADNTLDNKHTADNTLDNKHTADNTLGNKRTVDNKHTACGQPTGQHNSISGQHTSEWYCHCQRQCIEVCIVMIQSMQSTDTFISPLLFSYLDWVSYDRIIIAPSFQLSRLHKSVASLTINTVMLICTVRGSCIIIINPLDLIHRSYSLLQAFFITLTASLLLGC